MCESRVEAATFLPIRENTIKNTIIDNFQQADATIPYNARTSTPICQTSDEFELTVLTLELLKLEHFLFCVLFRVVNAKQPV